MNVEPDLQSQLGIQEYIAKRNAFLGLNLKKKKTVAEQLAGEESWPVLP